MLEQKIRRKMPDCLILDIPKRVPNIRIQITQGPIYHGIKYICRQRIPCFTPRKTFTWRLFSPPTSMMVAESL